MGHLRQNRQNRIHLRANCLDKVQRHEDHECEPMTSDSEAHGHEDCFDRLEASKALHRQAACPPCGLVVRFLVAQEGWDASSVVALT